MEALLGFIGMIGVLALILVTAVWRDSRSGELIRDWANQHGYEVVDHECAFLNRGPFFWTTGKSQTVYRICIRDPQGTTREGWARCGSWWGGLMSDDIEVRWDEQMP